jgi:DMSO/TMAO reductase YedYZ molybdopterin-dependent catalytic subunit
MSVTDRVSSALEQRMARARGLLAAPARTARTTVVVGRLLAAAFVVCFLTGLYSHLLQEPLPGMRFPTWPDVYAVTQGLHVAVGIAIFPLLLGKLWTVFPRLFLWPPIGSPRELLERASIAVLVASGIFQLATGVLNIAQWYPWEFSFRRTHEAVAFVAIGSILVHVAVKLPVIRDALVGRADDAESGAADGPSRRTVLLGAGAASGLAVLLTAGQTVPFLRKVSVFGVRDGEGPQDLPVNRTARAAGAREAAQDPSFVLEVRHGGQVVSLTRDQLAELPQRTHRLPIACVEGWSRNATWTGVAIHDLLALVDAPADSTVKVRSMQTRGAFGTSELPGDFVSDPRTLLALELNGEVLDLDHGYPCRIIAPNRPGVMQTKWVRSLEVVA